MSLRKFVHLLDDISEWVGKGFSWVIISLIALTCFEVFTRRLLGKPTIWTLELSMYLFCACCMLALGYTEFHKGHVNVDILYNYLPPKWQAICNVFSFFLFGGLFSLILTIYGSFLFYNSVTLWERSPSAFNAPVWPSKFSLAIGFLFLFLQMFSNVIKDIYFLAKGEKL